MQTSRFYQLPFFQRFRFHCPRAGPSTILYQPPTPCSAFEAGGPPRSTLWGVTRRPEDLEQSTGHFVGDLETRGKAPGRESRCCNSWVVAAVLGVKLQEQSWETLDREAWEHMRTDYGRVQGGVTQVLLAQVTEEVTGRGLSIKRKASFLFLYVVEWGG